MTELPTVEKIKRCALKGMVASETLVDLLVLKGGNAIDLVLDRGSRASLDLDFSIPDEFHDLNAVENELREHLTETFSKELSLHLFDLRMDLMPRVLSEELADFWGGYTVVFKLSTAENFKKYSNNIEVLRRNAVSVTPAGQRKFKIEISKFEYCQPKQWHELDDGTVLYAYTESMIVAEKLRAICQQMKEYADIVKRNNRPGAPRGRDFFDIYGLVSSGTANPKSETFLSLLASTFKMKRVPTEFLTLVEGYRDFHSQDFQRVKDAMKPGETIEEFDFYFDFVLKICLMLSKSLGHM